MFESKEKNVFTIECENIVLREFCLEDLDELYALTLQPEITDFSPDWKATKEQRKYWLENFHIKENKEFLKSVPNIGDHLLILGIILKKTNEFIGWCLTAPKDELPSPNREIAYAISKDHRGRGYTTEATDELISQGGELAIDIALKTSLLPIKGVIALNASEVELGINSVENAHKKDIKAVIIAGENDKKFEEQNKIANLFSKAGLKNRFIIKKGLGHWFPEDLPELIDSSLDFI